MQPAPGYGGDAVDYRDKSGGARRITNVGAAPTPEIGNPRVGNRADIEQKALENERENIGLFLQVIFGKLRTRNGRSATAWSRRTLPTRALRTSVLGGTMRSRPALPLPRTPSRARLIYAHGIFAGGVHRRALWRVFVDLASTTACAARHPHAPTRDAQGACCDAHCTCCGLMHCRVTAACARLVIATCCGLGRVLETRQMPAWARCVREPHGDRDMDSLPQQSCDASKTGNMARAWAISVSGACPGPPQSAC